MQESLTGALEERIQKLEGKSLVDEKTSSLERRILKLESSIQAAKWAATIVISLSVFFAGTAAWFGSTLINSAEATRTAAENLKIQNQHARDV